MRQWYSFGEVACVIISAVKVYASNEAGLARRTWINFVSTPKRQNNPSIGPDELIQNAAHEAGQMLRIILHHTAMSAKRKWR
jgi:hypothetical protein